MTVHDGPEYASNLETCFMSIYTKMYQGSPKVSVRPIDDRIDMFFCYDKEGYSLIDGERIEMPSMSGLSGTVIYQVREFDEGVWTPERSLQVVGVQSSSDHKSFIRATGWNAVECALKGIEFGF